MKIFKKTKDKTQAASYLQVQNRLHFPYQLIIYFKNKINPELSIQPMRLLNKNKENIVFSDKSQKILRHRNDHSIQAKSPLKIPNGSYKKTDMTFRFKTQKLACSPTQFQTQIKQNNANFYNTKLQPFELSQQLHNISNQFEYQMSGVHDQLQLLQNMWELSNKIYALNIQFIHDPLLRIQQEIRRIFTLLAEKNLDDGVALASSKKIRLLNIIETQNSDKSISQKQFDSPCEGILSSGVKFSQKVLQEAQDEQIEDLAYEHYNNDAQNTQKDLEYKKILYMLDGKQKNTKLFLKKQMRPYNTTNLRSLGDHISSLSSFNQNSNSDSGITLFEIDRFSGSSRCSQSSQQFKKAKQGDFKNKKEEKISKKQKGKQPIESKRTDKQQKNGEIGNKRKILEDIVSMLNHKYNKNIKLE